MIIRFPRIRGLLVLASALVLAGCGAVGSGVTPTRLQIFTNGAIQATGVPTPAVTVYPCVRQQLFGVLYFSDGSAADYSPRETWTSSNPAVVQVGPTGLLSPQAAGSATITASYVSLQASIQVTVGQLTASDLGVQKADQQTLTSLNPSSGFTVVPGSTQQVVMVAKEDGVPRNISGSTLWNIEDSSHNPAPVTLKATNTGSALVIQPLDPALIGTSPYTLTATVGSDGTNTFCPAPITISMPLNIAALQSLTLAPQVDPAGGPALGYADSNGNPLPLVRGNTERMHLTGTFVNGQTQDLSLQGTYTSSNSRLSADPSAQNVANFDYVDQFGADILSTLSATVAGTTQVSATYSYPQTYPSTSTTQRTTTTSNTLTITTVPATLQAIAVSPSTGSVTASGNLDSQQYYAIGTFNENGTTISQDVSRQTTWATSDSTLAVINSTPSASSGLAGPVGTQGGSVPVTVTASIAPVGTQCATTSCAALTGTAALTVNPPPDAPTSPPPTP